MDNIETLNRLAREYNCAPVTPACLAGAAAIRELPYYAGEIDVLRARVAELEAQLALSDSVYRAANKRELKMFEELNIKNVRLNEAERLLGYAVGYIREESKEEERFVPKVYQFLDGGAK